jgi:drug/metabolite transporter superfamily protein YnfA
MVKQSLRLMGTFFTRERFGTPQILAGCLLVAFLAQCAWLIARQPPGAISPEELARVQEGRKQWQDYRIAGTPGGLLNPDESIRTRGAPYDPDHSPLWYLIESAPVAWFHVDPDSAAWFWLTRAPYVFIGALLGASLWYVSRRLYGNVGGYTALALYCFSPAVIRASSLWFSPPNIAGAWGTFGAVFTAIAVAHTLYAPREVVLWNWRRILLLGVSLALSVGSHFSLVLIVPILLGLMLYLAPHRVGAVVAILSTSIGVGLALIFASYFFHPGLFAHSLANAVLFRGTGDALRLSGAYLQVGREILGSGPVLALMGPAAVGFWLSARRSRYFGNSAPLLMAMFFMLLRVLSPHDAGSIYALLGVMFLFLFVAGIVADLRETRLRDLAMAVVAGILVANAIWGLASLFAIGR